jgi:hypothetical protein
MTMKKQIVFSLVLVLLVSICFPLAALTEEEIFVEDAGILLKYSLSNSPREIENAIRDRNGYSFDLSDVTWRQNSALSKNVKEVMNRYNVDYSMTTYKEGIYIYIIVNRRRGNNWFIFMYRYMTLP